MPIIQPKPVTIDGVTYDSYAQADKALGMPRGSVSKMMARERAVAEEIAVAIDAVMEDEVAEVAEQERPVSSSPALSDKPENALSSDTERQLIYKGVEYRSRREMADALDVDYLKLNAYLRKYDGVDEAVEKCISGETERSIIYDGATYRSFKALCDTHAIAPALVRQLASTTGTDKMNAFSDLAALRKVAGVREDITLTFVPHCVVQGVPYKNVKALAEHIGIEPNMMTININSEGLPATLRCLQDARTTEFTLNQSSEKISLDALISQIESGELEHFDLTRHTALQYPMLQDIDFGAECYEVEPVRSSIGTGEFTLKHQPEPEQEMELEMGGM